MPPAPPVTLSLFPSPLASIPSSRLPFRAAPPPRPRTSSPSNSVHPASQVSASRGHSPLAPPVTLSLFPSPHASIPSSRLPFRAAPPPSSSQRPPLETPSILRVRSQYPGHPPLIPPVILHPPRLDSAIACDFPCCLSFSPLQRPPLETLSILRVRSQYQEVTRHSSPPSCGRERGWERESGATNERKLLRRIDSLEGGWG